jgi:hypothetical protein
MVQGTFDAAPQTPAALLGAAIASALLYALRAGFTRELRRIKNDDSGKVV